MERSTEIAEPHTRRGLLRRGLALVVAAPMLASLLQVGTAAADDDNDDNDEDNRRGRGRGDEGVGRDADDPDEAEDERQNRPAPVGAAPRFQAFSADLVRVSAAAADFAASNPGSDPLADGLVRRGQRQNGSSSEGRFEIILRGAAANVSYDVFFAPAAGGARQALGSVGPTNSNGDLHALTPSALSGTSRVGQFVVARGGQDQFISSVGG